MPELQPKGYSKVPLGTGLPAQGKSFLRFATGALQALPLLACLSWGVYYAATAGVGWGQRAPRKAALRGDRGLGKEHQCVPQRVGGDRSLGNLKTSPKLRAAMKACKFPCDDAGSKMSDAQIGIAPSSWRRCGCWCRCC